MVGQQIGVVGGGQLAWMMAQGATNLGLSLAIQTPSAADPAVAIAQTVVYGAVEDAAVTKTLAETCQYITFENEFVDLAALSQIEQSETLFRPSLASLAPLLDKYEQRCFLKSAGLPTPKFLPLSPQPSLEEVMQLGLPVVVKARRHGYDGQGTLILRDRSAVEALLPTLQSAGDAWLLEEYIPFERELAVMVARTVDGQGMTYPVVETQQIQQICRRVLALNDLPESVTQAAEAIALTLMDRLQMVGIMGIELFLTADQRLVVNETAPRTHNSGHYTLDACPVSQFEQQLRVVAGFPLGDGTMQVPGAVMVNLLGTAIPAEAYEDRLRAIAALPASHVYWYNKTPRPGRKLGHITVLLDGETAEQRRSQAKAAIQTIEHIWYAQ